jgi:hypothetical protein
MSFRLGLLISFAGVAASLIFGLAFTRWPVDPVLGEISVSKSDENVTLDEHEPGSA